MKSPKAELSKTSSKKYIYIYIVFHISPVETDHYNNNISEGTVQRLILLAFIAFLFRQEVLQIKGYMGYFVKLYRVVMG